MLRLDDVVPRALAVGATTLAATASAASSAEWVVRKNQNNMTCYVQRADASSAHAPALLGTYPNGTAACRAAKALKTDPANIDAGKCQAFAVNTITECKSVGVDLK